MRKNKYIYSQRSRMNQMKNFVKWLGLSLLAVFMLAACGSDDDGSKEGNSDEGKNQLSPMKN